MTPVVVGFWLALALVAYTYLVYPALLALVVALRRRPPRPAGHFPGTATVVLAAYNEQATIDRRVRELAGQLADSGLAGEVIVVSDGSTDRTAELARAVGGAVRVRSRPHAAPHALRRRHAGAEVNANSTPRSQRWRQ